jgi:signal transduction histidine kinase
MALALEAAARNHAATRESPPELARRYDESIASERACDSALGALAPRLGESIGADIGRVRSLTAQWRAERTATTAVAPTSLINVLAATARLDSALARRQRQQTSRIKSIETGDVLLPSILVPILAALLFLIHSTGRRMAALADEAEQSRRALAVASEQKVASLRGLTHDLKNSLGAAGGFVTLLGDEIAGPLTTLQRDYVSRTARLIEKTFTAVEDALLVARTKAGELPVRLRREDLRTVVLESASDYLAATERAGLTLTVDVAENLPSVDTDRALVSKIIGNLLSNAVKYTPGGGRIWLRVCCRRSDDEFDDGSWVAVEVFDTGPGIPAEFRERIFDEFFRVPNATATARGEGIGLAMSRRVARLLGGDITLDSRENGGAAFTLWLPLHAAKAEGNSSDETGIPPDERGAHRASTMAANSVDAQARRVVPK